ncbi:unnamed protein product [Brugia timori]|uniref:Bm13515, isoform c n=2 Tax=Brugia TaxID=6278 RepID=A0A1I9G3U6_BRUMA|nr:Bm13515, isoform c [Brugia malayi]VDO29445.1 unnamed protein product [Brugia timori]
MFILNCQQILGFIQKNKNAEWIFDEFKQVNFPQILSFNSHNRIECYDLFEIDTGRLQTSDFSTLKVPCSRRRFNENYTLVESESPKGNELECELAA